MPGSPSHAPTLFAGIDAGGSHTEAVVVDGGLAERARARGRPGALYLGGVAVAADRIVETVRRALATAGTDVMPDALVVGAAGAGRAEERDALVAALDARHAARRVRVTTDAAVALWSVFRDAPGILVNAGSGSIAYGRDPAGTVWRTGGLGWQFGDEGSGYAIGRAALSAVGKAADGRGPATELSQGVGRAAGADTFDALVRWANAASHSEVAGLAEVVQAIARGTDGVAAAIVRGAAEELGGLIVPLLQRFPEDRRVRLALCGGVLSEGWPVRRALLTVLKERAPDLEIVSAKVDPPLGAAALASRLAAEPP